MEDFRLSYHEMLLRSTFDDRLAYLRLGAIVGELNFGYDRYLNQAFYKSQEWRNFRNHIIVRDGGNDLACEERPISGVIIIHHINPLSLDDFKDGTFARFDPDNVVAVSNRTHQAIHYGSDVGMPNGLAERTPGDTKLW